MIKLAGSGGCLEGQGSILDHEDQITRRHPDGQHLQALFRVRERYGVAVSPAGRARWS